MRALSIFFFMEKNWNNPIQNVIPETIQKVIPATQMDGSSIKGGMVKPAMEKYKLVRRNESSVL
jgi:hypothetical protein